MRFPALVLTGVTAAAVLSVLPAGAASAKAPARPHDFNGDGRGDLVVNASFSVRKGEIGHGLVAVLYGRTGRKQIIARDSPGVASVADHGDGFGESTASADFDRDGYADLAITGPDEDGVTLVYGSKKGLSSRVAFLRTFGTAADPGSGLAVGDFDRDGYPDLVATVRERYWIFSKVDKGRKQSGPAGSVVLTGGVRPSRLTPLVADFTGDGRADLFLSSTNYEVALLLKNSAAGLTDPVAVPGLGAVQAAVAGDLNGDRKADLVVGHLGEVRVYLGRSSGFAKPKSFTSETPGIPADGYRYSFGSSLAVGDVNRDGKDDLAIGSPQGGVNRSGQAVLLYGHANGVTTKGARLFSQKTKAFKADPERGDDFGTAVRLLDLAGDRHAELVIGDPGENKNTGRFYVLANTKGRITAKGVKKYQPRDFGLDGMYFGSSLRP